MTDSELAKLCWRIQVLHSVRQCTHSKQPLILEIEPRWFRGQAFDNVCVEVINTVMHRSGTMLSYHGNPESDVLGGEWLQVGNQQWLVPDLPAKKLFSWLYSGDWIMHGALSPLSNEDSKAIRGTSEMQLKWILKSRSWFIYAYYDNASLTVGVF